MDELDVGRKIMQCIFCKCPVSESSREHIVPESLGNIEHLAPENSVCSECNSYFAVKIEKPVLDSPFMRFLRAERKIPNKKGRFLRIEKVGKDLSLPQPRHFSRFLGKIALEAIAGRLFPTPGWNEEIVDNDSFDQLRDYVRRDRGAIWPFVYRTLYPANVVFQDNVTSFEVLHEYDFLLIDNQYLFFVFVLFGVEFSINMNDYSNSEFIKWSEENEHVSHLYSGKNAYQAGGGNG